MKNSSWKWIVTVICVLAAGVCYSCGGMTGGGDASGVSLFLSESGESAADMPGKADVPGGAPDMADGEGLQAVGGGPAAEDKDNAVTAGGSGASASGVSAECSSPEGGFPAGGQTAELCFVHVCGEVRKPGVYQLAAGSRIYEAVEMAGGFTDAAASSYLNLAQEIADGMKIAVPSEAELSAAGVPADGAGVDAGTYVQESAGSGKVNINTADAAQLMTLKGIGEARAADIIAYRDSKGPFQSIEDIMKVPGIKNAAFEKIKDDITV